MLETDLKKILKDVSLAAAEEGNGLALLIDEAQDLSAEDLTTLVAVSHAATGKHIDVQAAELGVVSGLGQLDNGFFRVRWDRTTQAEKRYLRAMCPEGEDGIGSGEVASRLHKTSQSRVRNSLIRKGIVYAPDHGVVAFTVPGMAGFISRQHGE